MLLFQITFEETNNESDDIDISVLTYGVSTTLIFYKT